MMKLMKDLKVGDTLYQLDRRTGEIKEGIVTGLSNPRKMIQPELKVEGLSLDSTYWFRFKPTSGKLEGIDVFCDLDWMKAWCKGIRDSMAGMIKIANEQ